MYYVRKKGTPPVGDSRQAAFFARRFAADYLFVLLRDRPPFLPISE